MNLIFGKSQAFLEIVFEHAFESLVVVDPEGIILMMNKTYRDFLGVEDPVGRHVTEIIENTRMHIVAQTGKPEIAEIQRIKGQDMIANRIPIFENGEVIAAVGTVVFHDIRQLHALAATVDQLKEELAYYKREFRRKMGAVYRFDQIAGTGEKMEFAKKLALRVANSDTTILITGESGTGKELFAHAIHGASKRKMGPFISPARIFP